MADTLVTDDPNEDSEESSSCQTDSGNVVYTMYFRHWKTGKIVRRADGRPFRFEV